MKAVPHRRSRSEPPVEQRQCQGAGGGPRRARGFGVIGRHPVAVCFLLTCAISWAGVLAVAAAHDFRFSDAAEAPVLFPPMLLGPPVACSVLTTAVIAGGIEEIGWSGFATPCLLQRHSALRAGLVLGPMWSSRELDRPRGSKGALLRGGGALTFAAAAPEPAPWTSPDPGGASGSVLQ